MPDGDVDDFTIDPDELDAVVSDVQACENRLETLTADLDRQINTLQGQWDGLAATAQLEAHQEWTQGMKDMRGALADLRAAAKLASGNYRGAADTNLTMWSQVQ